MGRTWQQGGGRREEWGDSIPSIPSNDTPEYGVRVRDVEASFVAVHGYIGLACTKYGV